jgi:ribulose-bisphosphate carboxylase large chain
MRIVGQDIIIQAGGGIWGHPDGGEAGAKALRQAIEVGMSGGNLQDYAKDHSELQRALETWGEATFK